MTNENIETLLSLILDRFSAYLKPFSEDLNVETGNHQVRIGENCHAIEFENLDTSTAVRFSHMSKTTDKYDTLKAEGTKNINGFNNRLDPNHIIFFWVASGSAQVKIRRLIEV